MVLVECYLVHYFLLLLIEWEQLDCPMPCTNGKKMPYWHGPGVEVATQRNHLDAFEEVRRWLVGVWKRGFCLIDTTWLGHVYDRNKLVSILVLIQMA